MSAGVGNILQLRGGWGNTFVFPRRSLVDMYNLVVKCRLWVNQLGQLSLPFLGVGKYIVIHVITWIMEVETNKWQTTAAYN